MTSNGSVASNIAYLYGIQILRLVLPLGLLSILTAHISKSQYGIYVYTLACASWLSIFVEYGFNVSATRRIVASTETKTTREVILETQAARWLLAGATLLFLAWAMLASTVFAAHREWAFCAWLLGVMTGMTPTYYYQATSKLRLVALMEAGGGVLTVVTVLLFIHSHDDFWLLSSLLVLVRLLIWQVLDRQMFADNSLSYRDTFNIRSGLFALKNGWNIFLVQAAASLYTSFNIVLLGVISSAYAVAIYGSSERLIRAGLSFVGQATSAIFPWLNTIKRQDPAKLAHARQLILLAFIFVSTACVPVIWWLASSISNILFHQVFPDLPLIIRIMSLVIPAIAVNNVLGFHFLVVDGQEKILNKVVFSAVPVSLTTGFLLSQKYGAAGMAVTWVIVEWLVSFALAVIILYKHKKSKGLLCLKS